MTGILYIEVEYDCLGIYISAHRERSAGAGSGSAKAIPEYGKSCGLEVEEYIDEQGCSLKSTFCERKEAGKLLADVPPGDFIIAMKSPGGVLGSAKEGVRLIKMLRKKSVSLHCTDLKENISTESERNTEFSKVPHN